MTARPARGPISCARLSRAASGCLWLAILDPSLAAAQTLTSNLFNPQRGAFVPAQEMPFRKIGDNAAADPAASPGTPPDPNQPAGQAASAPSRVGVPNDGLPATSSIGDSSFDALNRNRKQPRYYPGQAKSKPSPGPGTPPPQPPQVNVTGDLRLSIPPSDSANKPPIAPSMAGGVPGQPQRRRLKIDDDPFGAVGDYAGPFLI